MNPDSLLTPAEMYDNLYDECIISPAYLGRHSVTLCSSKDCAALLVSLFGGRASEWKRVKKFSPKGASGRRDIRVFSHAKIGLRTVVQDEDWDAHIFNGDRLDTVAIRAAIAELKIVPHCGDYGSLYFNSASGRGVVCMGDGGYGDENGNASEEVEAVMSKYAVADEWSPYTQSGFFYVGDIGTVKEDSEDWD